MSARKARKLADGSREETFNEETNEYSSENSEDENDIEDSQNQFSTQATNDETNQDESMSEDEQDSAEENERPLSNDEIQADCGTVESLTLFNFMCHEHFEITFNPRVNFVIGKNGSGKSAILTAIVVALGGRASNTGRGQSLTGFIKNGKTSAKISVKLCNYSVSKKKTFKFSEYGRSIIVERTIKLDGTSNYVLKSATGKIISRKKEELCDIINLFSIQIENPVCILSQEVSRNFLNTKNPRDKYNFFMKATNLEQLKQAYAIALQQSRTANEILDKKKGFLPSIEFEVKELEKKVEVFTKFNKKKDELTYLICELVWAMVKILEVEESKPPKAIKEIDEKIKEAKERYESIKQDSENLNKIGEDFGTKTQDEFEQEIKRLDSLKVEMIKRLEQLRKTRSDKQFKINEINFSISSCDKDKAQLSKKIEDIKMQIKQQEKLIAEQERIKCQRIQMQNEQDDIKKDIENLRAEKNQKQDEYNRSSEQMKSLNYKMNKLTSDLSNKNNLLLNLKGSGIDGLTKFGQPHVNVVRKIDEEMRKGSNCRFKHRPIGPLGYYIKIKDDHIATALETCLKGLMFAFVCDNHQDVKILDQIIRSVRFQSPPLILKRKFGPRFRIEKEVTLDRYKSFLSFVTIENDQAFNILMDKTNLEKTLYIPNEKTAVELLTNEGLVPHDLKVAYSATGTQFFPRKGGSNFRQYANNRKASGILTSDTSLLIKKIDAEVEDLKVQVTQLQNEKSELDATMRRLNGEMREFDKKIDLNHSKINNISRQLYELSSVKEFKPEDLSIFEGDYQQCVNQIESFKDEIQTLQNDLKDIEQKIKIVKNDQSRNDQEMQDKREKFEKIKKRVRENEFHVKKNQTDLEKIERRVAEFNERKEVHMQELTDIRLKKEQAIAKAKEKHDEPIDTNRKPNEIQVEIEELEQFLRENEGRMGNREELFALYKEKKIHLEKMREQVEFLETYITQFNESIKRRARIYCKLRNWITKETSTRFAKNLKLLNFTGSLEIYHQSTEVNGKAKKEQTLDIKINPKSSDPNLLYNDTRSLSGGERSFSTVAFLIALWESSYSPFNILDEIDVFMDRVTRNMALDAIIESANKKKGKQYIFLSPLRPEKKSIQNLLKIFYMPDPNRVAGDE